MAFTVELGGVAVVFECGCRYDLNGKVRLVTADAVLDDVSVPVDGPCPACGGPDDGGEEEPAVTAAE